MEQRSSPRDRDEVVERRSVCHRPGKELLNRIRLEAAVSRRRSWLGEQTREPARNEVVESDQQNRDDTGSGPTVEGPAQQLLLAVAGCRLALDRLSGEGLATLRSR
jgi:hypothetical protein